MQLQYCAFLQARAARHYPPSITPPPSTSFPPRPVTLECPIVYWISRHRRRLCRRLFRQTIDGHSSLCPALKEPRGSSSPCQRQERRRSSTCSCFDELNATERRSRCQRVKTGAATVAAAAAAAVISGSDAEHQTSIESQWTAKRSVIV